MYAGLTDAFLGRPATASVRGVGRSLVVVGMDVRYVGDVSFGSRGTFLCNRAMGQEKRCSSFEVVHLAGGTVVISYKGHGSLKWGIVALNCIHQVGDTGLLVRKLERYVFSTLRHGDERIPMLSNKPFEREV